MSTGAAELLQDTGGTITDEAATTTGEIAARSPLALFWRRLRQGQGRARRAGRHRAAHHHRDLRRPDREAVRRASAERAELRRARLVRLGRGAGPRLHHGDRRARARCLQPHDLRRAHIARDRLPRHRPDRDDRRDAGHDRGLLPRFRRHRAVALDGRGARLPGAPARPRPRRGVLAEGLPDGRRGRPRPLHLRARHPAHPGHRRGHIAAARAPRLPRPHGQRLGAAPGAGRRLSLGRHRLLVRPLVERDADPAGPARRDLRHHARRLALHGAHHPRPGALAAREGVRRGRPLAGRLRRAHHLPPHPAEPRGADHRLHNAS